MFTANGFETRGRTGVLHIPLARGPLDPLITTILDSRRAGRSSLYCPARLFTHTLLLHLWSVQSQIILTMYSFDWAKGYVSPFRDRDGESVYTTPPSVVDALIDCILASPRWCTGSPRLLVDLGSGDGRIVLAAARRGISAMGVELDPALVEAAHIAAAAEGLHTATFVCASLLEVELPAEADIVAYLLPEGLAKLARRLAAQSFAGHFFALRWSLEGQADVQLVRRLPLTSAMEVSEQRDDCTSTGTGQGETGLAARWVVHEYECVDAASALAREAAIAQHAWRMAQAARLNASSSSSAVAPAPIRYTVQWQCASETPISKPHATVGTCRSQHL